MKRFLNVILLCFLLLVGISYATNWTWTTFSKTTTPVAQPQTAFFSGGCIANAAGACSTTGKYWSGTMLMAIDNTGVFLYVPMFASDGTRFLTGVDLTPYLTLADSGVYFETNSGIYFESNSGTYFLAHSGEYFEANSGTYYDNNIAGSLLPYLLIVNSGTYYDNNIAGSLLPYLLLANSGTYYTSNPLGYITGSSLTPYLLIANSGTYYTSNPLGYITGSALVGYATGTVVTSMSYPGADTNIPTEQAVVSYIEDMAGGLESFITTGGYYISGGAYYWKAELTGGFYGISYFNTDWITPFKVGYTGAYGLMYDFGGNIYLTGYTETDPVWSAVSGNYLTIANSGTYYDNNIAGDLLPYCLLDGGNTFSGNQSITNGYVQTDTAFYFTGGTIPWRFALSGDNLSIQAYTGGAWVEKGSFTP